MVSQSAEKNGKRLLSKTQTHPCCLVRGNQYHSLHPSIPILSHPYQLLLPFSLSFLFQAIDTLQLSADGQSPCVFLERLSPGTVSGSGAASPLSPCLRGGGGLQGDLPPPYSQCATLAPVAAPALQRCGDDTSSCGEAVGALARTAI